MSILDGFLSLGRGTNKTSQDQNDPKEGAGDPISALTLDMSDEELLKLTKDWKSKWDDSDVKSTWTKLYEDNENYWKGQHYSALEVDSHALMDNAIFEALETFLPQATRRNPEPQVEVEDPQKPPPIQFPPNVPPEAQQQAQAQQQQRYDQLKKSNQAFADGIEKRLIALADILKLRLKIKKAARHWAIYLLGVAKVGWSQVTNDITIKIIRPPKLILDPDASVDEDGYNGEYVGEYKTQTADLLIKLFPKSRKFLSDKVKDKLGTDITYIEWNTTEYICWTLDDQVLGKSKNVNWNYDTEPQNQQQTTVDEFGNSQPAPQPAKNHFPAPRIPYVFLTVFNLGKQPVDETSLITQNLPLQDLINQRLRQIHKNADSQNGGLAVSGDHFTQDQAKQVSDTVRKGGTIFIPHGSVNDAILKLDNKPLGAEAFTQLADTRSRLADVFGTRGSTASGIANEETVRGKIITRGLDTDRIGGGVTEYLEQFADDILNWCVQLMYVYYKLDETVPGGIPDTKLTVSVKEGSLLPKDNVTLANQAMELATKGLMSLIDLYTKLEDPNPKERAANAWLEKNAPQVLYADDPRIQQVVAQMQAQAQAQQQQATAGKQQEHQQNLEGKQVDHAHKMEQQTQSLEAEKEAALLKQVPVH